MTSNSSSPTHQYRMRNGQAPMDQRRPPRMGVPPRFPSSASNPYYSEEQPPMDPQLQGPNSLDTYPNLGFSRSSSQNLLTFGAGGMGSGSNDHHADMRENDRTLHLPQTDVSSLHMSMHPYPEPDPTPWLQGTVEDATFRTSNQTVKRPQHTYTGYRNSAGSDFGTQYSHAHQDSGYGTTPFYSEPYSQQGDDTQSLLHDVEDTRQVTANFSLGHQPPTQAAMGSQGEAPNAEAGPSAHNSGWDLQSNTHRYCEIPGCQQNKDRKAMNESEYKKHKNRHDKPYGCTVTGCKRKEGFATKNDLARHRKSVHEEVTENCNERTFICKSNKCNHHDKKWPRFDNFKAHCRRKHKSEDLEELIRRSELFPSTGDAPHGSGGVAAPPMMPRVGPPEPATEGAETLLALSQTGTPRPGPPSISPVPALPSTARADAGFAAEPGAREPIASESNNRPKLSLQTVTRNEAAPIPVANTHALTVPAAEVRERLSPTPPGSRRNSISEAQKQRLRDQMVSDFKAAQEQDSKLTPEQLAEIALSSYIKTWLRTKRTASDAGFDIPQVAERRTELPPAAAASALQPGKFQCSKCSETKNRLCDMKKHEKRHSRPWGCTHEDCDKSFGSKNDWKRHENSQHYQAQAWRCSVPSNTSKIGICAKKFSRADPFRNHLKQAHKHIDETYLREQCRLARVGCNWQDRFWCGFCGKIIKLQHKGLLAWDERFNHIDDEHFKKGEQIDNWYPLDKDRTKGELREERRNRKKGPIDNDYPFATSGEEDSSHDEGVRRKKGGSDAPPSPPPPPPPPNQSTPGGSAIEPPFFTLPPVPSPPFHAQPSPPPPDVDSTESTTIDSTSKPSSASATTRILTSDSSPASATGPTEPSQPSSPELNSHDQELRDCVAAARKHGHMLPLAKVKELYQTTGRRVKYTWACCKCKFSSLDPRLSKRCVECEHQACASCEASVK